MKNTKAKLIAGASLLVLSSAAVYADRGRGSIRAAAPVQRTEVRQAPQQVHVEEKRVDVHVETPRPAPHVEVQTRRDWDDNDEDGRHFGGFAPGCSGARCSW